MKTEITFLQEDKITIKLLSRPSSRKHWGIAQEQEMFESLRSALIRGSDCSLGIEIRYIPDAGNAGIGLTSCNGLLCKDELRGLEFFISDFAQYQVRNCAEHLNRNRQIDLTFTKLKG